MSTHRSSSLFLIGLISMCSVWLTFPFWRPKPDTAPQPEPSARQSRERTDFYHAPPREERSLQAREADRSRVKRALGRRARMQRDGLVQNVIENKDMPEAVRSRFRKEMERLDRLAEAHPELAVELDDPLVGRQVTAENEFTPEFKEVVEMMQMSGVWDDLSEQHVRELIQRRNDPDVPEDQKPSMEEIEQARSGKHIPTL